MTQQSIDTTKKMLLKAEKKEKSFSGKTREKTKPLLQNKIQSIHIYKKINCLFSSFYHSFYPPNFNLYY